MANFNGYDDVRTWLAQHGETELRESVAAATFRGKTLDVARAYLTDLDSGALNVQTGVVQESDGLHWRGWQIAAAAGVLIVPALLVWAINAFRG
jgi:hypothetical protein